MAAVTFNIRAIDGTRAAFASVNQNLRNLTSATDKTAKQLLGGLAGGALFTGLVQEIKEVVANVEKIPGIDPAVTQSVVDFRNTLAGVRVEAQRNIAGAVSVFATAGKSIGATLGALNLSDFLSPMRLAAGLGRAQADVTAALKKETDDYVESLKKMNEQERNDAIAKRAAAEAAKAKTAELARIDRMAKEILSAQDFFAKSEREFTDGLMRSGAEIKRSVMTPTEQYSATVADLAYKHRMGAIDIQTFNRAVGEASRKLDEANKAAQELQADQQFKQMMQGFQDPAGPNAEQAMDNYGPQFLDNLDRYEEKMREIGSAAREAGGMIAGAFEDAIFEGGKLSDVLRDLARDLMRLMFRKSITDPLSDMLAAPFVGVFGGLMGRRALGGPVSAGGSYLVGENGPELFQPGESGRIVPNGSMSGAGGTVVLNIDARGADRTGIDALRNDIRRLDSGFSNRVLATVGNTRVRGGMRGAVA